MTATLKEVVIAPVLKIVQRHDVNRIAQFVAINSTAWRVYIQTGVKRPHFVNWEVTVGRAFPSLEAAFDFCDQHGWKVLR